LWEIDKTATVGFNDNFRIKKLQYFLMGMLILNPKFTFLINLLHNNLFY